MAKAQWEMTEEEQKESARKAFARLPAETLAAVREACEAADVEGISELLSSNPAAATAAAPFLKDFRMDLLAALLPES